MQIKQGLGHNASNIHILNNQIETGAVKRIMYPWIVKVHVNVLSCGIMERPPLYIKFISA